MLNELLVELERKHHSVPINNIRMVILAYEDDLVLCGPSPVEAKAVLRTAQAFLAKRGMALHPDKCYILTTVGVPHKKKLVVNARRRYYVDPLPRVPLEV